MQVKIDRYQPGVSYITGIHNQTMIIINVTASLYGILSPGKYYRAHIIKETMIFAILFHDIERRKKVGAYKLANSLTQKQQHCTHLS
jgi:hypothetical protein